MLGAKLIFSFHKWPWIKRIHNVLQKENQFPYQSKGDEDTIRIVVFKVKSRGAFIPGICNSEQKLLKVDFTSPDFPIKLCGEHEPDCSWAANPFNALSYSIKEVKTHINNTQIVICQKHIKS